MNDRQDSRAGGGLAARRYLVREPRRPDATPAAAGEVAAGPVGAAPFGPAVDPADLTAPRAVEDRLRATEERLRLVLDGAGMGSFHWTIPTGEVVWSDAYRRIFALPPGAPASYAAWLDGVPESVREDLDRRVRQAMEGHQDLDLEYPIRWPDGSTHWVSGRGRFIYGDDGRPERMEGVVQDITARKEAEAELRTSAAALRESEQRFRYAMEATSDGLWDWDLRTGRVYYSPGYARMLGYAPEALAGDASTWVELLHPEERERIIATVQWLLHDPGHYELEFRMRTSTGAYRWVLSRGKVVEWDAAGAIGRALGTHIDITERKHSELALRRYRQIVECSSEKLLFLDRDLRYQLVNPAYAAMFLRTPDDLHGHAMAEFLSPETWAQVHPYLEAVLTGMPQRFRFEATYPDGHTRYFEAEKQPFRQDGQIQGIVASLHDLTEIRAVQAALEADRMHLEERVAARTAQLQTLADRLQLATWAARMGIWELDLQSGQVTWDARLRELYGLPDGAPDPTYETWLAWIDPEDRPLIQAANEWFLRGEDRGFQAVLRVHCPDGRERYIVAGARLQAGASGGAGHLVGVNWDLTAQRESALALAASEARAQAVLEASPVPLAIAHETGPVRYLNAAFVATFGYTPEDLPAWSDWCCLALPDPVERERVLAIRRERLAQAARDGRPCEPLEVAVRCKDGTARTVMVRTTPLDGGECLNTLYDVTELKEARDAAERAARAKSDFLAHMSHEIRTPMNSVLGLAQVLERSALAPDQRLIVAQIRAAGRSLLDILNDILDLTKIEAGGLGLDRRPFALAPLLTETADLFAPTARTKGLRFETILPAALGGGLLGDPLRLQQVLVNLIGNAVKFTERGEVRLLVEPRECGEEQVRLRFEVRDTGIGLTAEALGRLFRPFTQADGSITRRFGGTGLGLAICKRLVESMGGVIGAVSRAGEGSTFWFELSFERVPQARSVPPIPPRDARPTGPRLAGVRVLVVDDSPANRLVAERMLALEGARATPTEDGRQALDLLRTAPQGFDAVLMDVQMPVMDGLTAARLIRAEPGLTDLPVIALTAGVLESQQAAALGAGMNDVLTKPLDLERMVALLSKRVQPRPDAALGAPPDQASRGPGGPPEGFPEIAGIDRQAAARALAGNRALFLDLLARFTDEFAAVVPEARRALAAGERETAARRLHTLKGNAGSLGALDLMAAAAGLEGAIAQGATGLEERLAALDARIGALIRAAAPWRGTAEGPLPATSAAAATGDQDRLHQLREALRIQDLAALQHFRALRPWFCAAMGEDGCGALGRAIRDLRYAEALVLVDRVVAGGSGGRG